MDEEEVQPAQAPAPAEPSEARRALVKRLNETVKADHEHWSPRFERMREDMEFVRGKQWEGQSDTRREERYVANITQRHVQQRVAALYAKDPTVVARVRPRMDYTLWDGSQEMLQNAMMTAQAGDPVGMAIMTDFQNGMERQRLMKLTAKTLEIAAKYYTDEQIVPFKKNMKRLVRRTVTTGVSYINLDYQRVLELSPDMERQMADYAGRIASIQRMLTDMEAGDTSEIQAEAERLRIAMAALESEEEVLVREGVTFDFLPSTSVIPDRRCRSLDGFVGCQHVAIEYYLKPEEVQEIYGVKLGKDFEAYTPLNPGAGDRTKYVPSFITIGDSPQDRGFARVFVIQSKKDGVVYTVCDGYNDFLTEPGPPNIKLERFWTVFTLMFNEIEDDRSIYPPSDVELVRPMQEDFNRARQGRREHRIANRPMYVTSWGQLSDEDKFKLETRPANAIVELEGLPFEQPVNNVLQAFQHAPILPELYETETTFQDILRVAGSQEANLGGTSGATATEVATAEGSRISSLQSNVDDLDEFLTELYRSVGMLLLMEVTEQTIKRIAGPGAVWPQMTRNEIVEEIMLEIEAGSTGRPNQVQELQNLERITPFLLQIPGIPPRWLAEQMLRRLNDNLNLEEAFQEGIPSITAMNQNIQLGTGDPGTDPNQQGGEGGNNKPPPAETEGDTGRPGRPPMEPQVPSFAS